jgi:hypothetical protein
MELDVQLASTLFGSNVEPETLLTLCMSFFARQNRYLARGTRLMIHERKLSKKLVIDGPLTTCVAVVKATLNEIECSIAIQNEGFQNLVLGYKAAGTRRSLPEDVVIGRPSLWVAEDFGCCASG